jgi:hypothetical protein
MGSNGNIILVILNISFPTKIFKGNKIRIITDNSDGSLIFTGTGDKCKMV